MRNVEGGKKEEDEEKYLHAWLMRCWECIVNCHLSFSSKHHNFFDHNILHGNVTHQLQNILSWSWTTAFS